MTAATWSTAVTAGIAAILRAANLTQTDVAAEMGVRRQQVSRWMAAGWPTRRVDQLLEVLGLDAEALADVIRRERQTARIARGEG